MSVFYHSIYNIDTVTLANSDTAIAGFGLIGLIGLTSLIFWLGDSSG